ncbi:mucin-2-like isoform X2 [Sycon ciliatum]|uniref:mucin-2-like isoform X2 n=1 Tax=Sycon ciliatum TaxID=27933 RepID=UPI0031F6AB25
MYPSVGLTNNGSHSSPGGFNQQHALNCNVQTVPTASTAGQFNPIIQNGHHHHHHHHHPLQQVQQVQPAAVQAVPHMTITQPSACISFPAQSTLPGGISSPVVTHQMPPGCTAATPAGLHPAGTPAYQLGSPIQQPLALTTLTITQPPFIRSGQPVQSTITLGSNGHHLSVSPSSNGHHPPPPLQHQHRSSSNSRAAESAPASSTTPNSTHQHSSHSNQQTNLVDVCSVSDTEDSQRHRRRIGGFNFDDMNTLWTTPQSNAKQNKVPMSNGNSTTKETAPKRTATSSSSPIAGRRGNKSSSAGARTPTTPPSSTTTATSQSDSTHQYRFPFNKQNPPARDFDSSSTPSGQLTITVKAGEEEEAQLSRMCTVHPRTRDIRIRRLERLPSHRRHFRCETCTDILNDFVSEHGFYPTDNQKKDLLRNVGMTPTMLSYWFSNRRRTSPVGLTSLTRKTR